LRVALVSPLPPSISGIADYTIDVARSLQDRHRIELFFDQDDVAPSSFPAFPVSELPTRPRDVVIYQMGNGPAHDFMYDWIERVPGIVVLHDLVLHHSFARRFLESVDARAYAADPSDGEKRIRAEAQHDRYEAAVETIYPGHGRRLREAFLNSSGDLLPYAFPLFEPAMKGALAIGAHNAFMVEAIRSACPTLSCVQVAMPVEASSTTPASVAALRSRLGLSPDDPVIGTFGLVTREKRIETVARGVARVAAHHPSLRWLIVGEAADRAWLEATLRKAGVRERTIVAGRLAADEFAAALELSTGVVHLRYPTARETSAALLRALVQGRPTIVSDIANQAEIPEDAVLRVDPADEEGDLARAIDRLLRDPSAAREMGERARAFAAREHSPAKTLETYDRLLNSVDAHYSQAPA
jgi:glycosyltransferase involved in cell wall biosynthesis